MLESLAAAGALLLAVLGFGLVILIHEAGHFFAAKWAGIRVYAFAIGFGPAAVAYRKGVGLRRGSTNPDTLKALRKRLEDRPGPVKDLQAVDRDWPADIGKTEYRLNWLPLGGYVQMRGQDDVAPGESAVDAAPDSYVSKPIWKRMVVVSAGVVMNLVLAAILFVVVFMAGLDVFPARVGAVGPGSPAATAVATNAQALGVEQPGLQPGDDVITINGSEMVRFADINIAVGLSHGAQPVEIVARRDGVAEPLRFRVEPDPTAGELRALAVSPPITTTLAPAGATESEVQSVERAKAVAGLAGVPEGAALVEAGGEPLEIFQDIDRAFTASGGEPVTFTWRKGDETGTVQIAPRPALQQASVEIAGGRTLPVDHLLGFVPPMRVEAAQRAARFGLQAGDVIARIGTTVWPGPIEGTRAIRQAAGESIQLTVRRDGEMVRIEASVTPDGTIGFAFAQARAPAVVTRPLPEGAVEPAPPASTLDLPPGTVIEAVEGRDVAGYDQLRDALLEATAEANAQGSGATIQIACRLPVGGFAQGPVERHALQLTPEDVESLHALGWTNPVDPRLFLLERTTLRAGDPLTAIVMGVQETHKMVLRTYLTVLRLIQGSVAVEQLRGPVGIAHIGTQVAQRSFIELLFFFAVISANLAVLNFLPLPIVDGGLFVFLLIEKMTGKPVSPAVQNAAALVGLALIGSLFLLVTFHDITRLLGA